ncbi:MAG: hypothetical protein NT128_02505 [Proteobacteria bacterium]|nr:hypothetical protein [Pseudomonadota bacterium]
MKNTLLSLIAVGLMNAMVNASSSDNLDPDFQKQKQQVLQAFRIFVNEVKPSALVVDDSRKSVVATDRKAPVVDATAIDVVNPNAEAIAIAEELVPIAGKTKSLDIPDADYVEQMKTCGQHFESLTQAVDDALKPAYNLAVGNISLPQLPSESLASLHSQESALKKQLKELNARSFCDEWSDDSEDESPIHRTTTYGKQQKEFEDQKEQIKKQLQTITEKIRYLKAAKKHVHDIERFKSKMLANQNNAKADNFRIEKSTARLRLLFDQANSERQKQFQEQTVALTDSLKKHLLEKDKEFEEECRVAKQKAAQLIEKNPDQAQRTLAVDIGLYAKKHKALKRLAKLQSQRVQALRMYELAAELASFKLDYEKILADFQNKADIAALIISGDNDEITIPLLHDSIKSSSKV